jgi:hypothetical protein
MIKLCYKEYPFKVSFKACKVFHDQTGLDLPTVFMDYIAEYNKTTDMQVAERLVFLAKMYTRDIASKALHAVIDAATDGISLGEIEDAAYRVSWVQSERNDDLSEPWPMVMLSTALEINNLWAKDISVKKTDTSADTPTG